MCGIRYYVAVLFHPKARAYTSYALAFEQAVAEHLLEQSQQKYPIFIAFY